MLPGTITDASVSSAHEGRYRDIFRRLHAGHDRCAADEWLREPCRRGGVPVAPIVWSRRNGPWRQVPMLLVGAAPGNAGGRGSGDMGAHGTRIPFGGDIAGANLDLLLRAVALTRDDVFITAALNRLPDQGGGEPGAAEMARPMGAYPDSMAALRDTILASGARLVVALGNVALRACVAAAAGRWRSAGGDFRLPGLRRLEAGGVRRGEAMPWPNGAGVDLPGPDAPFRSDWLRAWDAPPPRLLWLLHPSAQNMSPHAGVRTAFHRRMVETLAALRRAAADAALALPVEPRAAARPSAPGSVYDTPEWRERVGDRHDALLDLWGRKGL
jgi:uracil-DNA glycosylase